MIHTYILYDIYKLYFIHHRQRTDHLLKTDVRHIYKYAHQTWYTPNAVVELQYFCPHHGVRSVQIFKHGSVYTAYAVVLTKYCLNHCARTCCSLRIAVAIRPRRSECRQRVAFSDLRPYISNNANFQLYQSLNCRTARLRVYKVL